MNSDTLQGKWKQAKGAIKERWGKLTDDDMDVINGQRDQLVGRVQERYGIAKDQAQKQVDEWMHSDWDQREDRREKDESIRKAS